MAFKRYMIAIFLMMPILAFSTPGESESDDLPELEVLQSKIADAIKAQSPEALLLIGDLQNLSGVDKNHLQGLKAYYKGEIAYYDDAWDQAITFYQASIKYFQLSSDSLKLAAAYNNLGLVYLYQAAYDNALDAFSKSMDLEIAMNNQIGIGQCYQNMALVLEKGGQRQRALGFFYQALAIYETEEDWAEAASVNNNLANFFSGESDYKKAAYYYDRSIEIYKRLGMEDYEAILLCNIGALMIKEGDYDRSGKLLERALFLMTEKGNRLGVANVYSILGDLYVARKEYQQAIFLYNKAEDVASEYNLNELRLQNLFSLYVLYKEMSVWQKALNTYEQYVELKDKILLENPEYGKGILDKEVEQKLLERDLLLYKAGLQQKYLWWGLGLLLFAIAVASWFVWLRYRTLRFEKEMEDNQKQLIKDKVNPVFVCSLLESLRDSMHKGNLDYAINHLDDVTVLIKKMIEHSCQELIPLSQEIEFLKLYFSVQKQRFNKEVTYQIHTNLQNNVDQVMVPSMLTQPFLEHAFEGICFNDKLAGPNVKIAFMRRDNYLDVIIENNGSGIGDFEDEELEKRHRANGVSFIRTQPGILRRRRSHDSFMMFTTEQSILPDKIKKARVKFSLPFMIN